MHETSTRSYMFDEMQQPQRCFLLLRTHSLSEVPILSAHDDGEKVFAHYLGLLSGSVPRSLASTTIEWRYTEIGPLLVIFAPEFPDSALPFNGGPDKFSANGYDYHFDTFGANTVRTVMDAEILHSQGLCKPLMCSDHTCFNYCGALDEFMFVPPLAFFARQCRKYPSDDDVKGCDILDGDQVFESSGVREITEKSTPICVVARATPILLDEYVIELESLSLPVLNGEVIIGGARWELFPVPSDASRLDMHLAQISSLDTKYAQRFTREVRYMDEVKDPRKIAASSSQDAADNPEEAFLDSLWESDSDNESYVESALIPGLRHRDFSKPISIAKTLSGLTLDEKTTSRMKDILAS